MEGAFSLSSSPLAATVTVGSGAPPKKEHILGGTTVEELGAYILRKDIRKILVLIGAGVSVAAGIPDFRSPNTGLYANLAKYGLDEPSDAFSLGLLRTSPGIFYSIATEMNLWPGSYKPTAVHHFVKLLSDEGRLLRCCTQNIDGLERAAGVPEELLVEAHGSFRTASCIDCHKPYDIDRNHREADEGLVSHCDACGGIVKPDVVFFGEQLPERFFSVLTEDTAEAELVLVIGTSLQVRPFALLPLHARPEVPRVLVNMERVGGRMFRFPDDDDFVAQLLGRGVGESNPESSTVEEGEGGRSARGSGDDDAQGGRQVHELTKGEGAANLGESPEDPGALAAGDGTDRQALSPSAPHLHGPLMPGTGIRNDPTVSSDHDGRSSGGSSSSSDGFLEYEEFTAHYKSTEVFRDLFLKGDCQASITCLAQVLGLGERLDSARMST